MTTVICYNGYMVSDHRSTIVIKKDEAKINIVTKEQDKIADISDSRVKIFLPRHGVRVIDHKGPMVKAFGCAGSSEEVKKVRNFISFLKPDEYSLNDLFRTIQTVCGIKTSIAVLMLMDDGTSRMKTFQNEKMTSAVFGKNDIGCIGSGSSIIKGLRHVLPETVHIEELFALSAMTDKYTSPSYSVYSLQDNVLYTSVIPSIQYLREKAQLLLSRLDFSRNIVFRQPCINDN